MRTLEFIATILWAGNICFGVYPLLTWQLRGGRTRSARIAVLPSALFFAHPVLSAGGLALWAVFLHNRRMAYAWSSFGVLCASAMLGFVMLTRWLEGWGGRHAHAAGERFPAKVVALHVVVGLTTFTLVLITAALAMQRHPH